MVCLQNISHLKNRYYTSTWPIHETVKNFEKGKASVSTYEIHRTLLCSVQGELNLDLLCPSIPLLM